MIIDRNKAYCEGCKRKRRYSIESKLGKISVDNAYSATYAHAVARCRICGTYLAVPEIENMNNASYDMAMAELSERMRRDHIYMNDLARK